jgi:hypothetical protein
MQVRVAKTIGKIMEKEKAIFSIICLSSNGDELYSLIGYFPKSRVFDHFGNFNSIRDAESYLESLLSGA